MNVNLCNEVSPFSLPAPETGRVLSRDNDSTLSPVGTQQKCESTVAIEMRKI
jgi:hypothetical protein